MYCLKVNKELHNQHKHQLTLIQMDKLEVLKASIEKMVDCPTKKKLLKELEQKITNKLIKK